MKLSSATKWWHQITDRTGTAMGTVMHSGKRKANCCLLAVGLSFGATQTLICLFVLLHLSVAVVLLAFVFATFPSPRLNMKCINFIATFSLPLHHHHRNRLLMRWRQESVSTVLECCAVVLSKREKMACYCDGCSAQILYYCLPQKTTVKEQFDFVHLLLFLDYHKIIRWLAPPPVRERKKTILCSKCIEAAKSVPQR